MAVRDYYSGWKQEGFACATCSWSGTGAQTVQGEMFDDFVVHLCPVCPDKTLFALMFPTIAESRANWDKVSEGDKLAIQARETFLRDIEARNLRTVEQLPEIHGDEDIVLVWDCQGGDTLIRYGNRLIWHERAQYEGYERFQQVADLLKQKYGDRLQDLVPTRRSTLYLYGDKLGSPSRIQAFREQLGLYPNEKALRERLARKTAERNQSSD